MHTLIQSLATEGAAATEGGHAAYAWLLIALPALGAARESSRRTVCLANTRQMVLGMTMYSARLPGSG